MGKKYKAGFERRTSVKVVVGGSRSVYDDDNNNCSTVETTETETIVLKGIASSKYCCSRVRQRGEGDFSHFNGLIIDQ